MRLYVLRMADDAPRIIQRVSVFPLVPTSVYGSNSESLRTAQPVVPVPTTATPRGVLPTALTCSQPYVAWSLVYHKQWHRRNSPPKHHYEGGLWFADGVTGSTREFASDRDGIVQVERAVFTLKDRDTDLGAQPHPHSKAIR